MFIAHKRKEKIILFHATTLTFTASTFWRCKFSRRTANKRDVPPSGLTAPAGTSKGNTFVCDRAPPPKVTDRSLAKKMDTVSTGGCVSLKVFL